MSSFEYFSLISFKQSIHSRLCGHVLLLFLIENKFINSKFFDMRNIKLTAAMALIVLHFSCSKGSTGPAGPQGPVGTANVIYSPWFLTGTGWDTTLGAPYGAVAAFDRTAPGITQAIIDSGIVLAYMKGDPTTTLTNDVFPLPYSVGAGFGFTDLWDFALNAPGNIRFLYKSDLPWTTTELGAISFRYMIVPGGVAGGRMLDRKSVV